MALALAKRLIGDALGQRSDLAEDLVQRFEHLKTDRAPWDRDCEDVSRFLAPQYRGTFAATDPFPTQEDVRDEYIFDSTPQTKLDRFVAVMESILTPAQQVWHRIEAQDPEVQRVPRVSKYFEEVNRRIWGFRQASNFVSQNTLYFESQGITGLGCQFVDALRSDIGFRYKFVHPGEVFFASDHQGIVNLVYRRFSLTAREAADQFGPENLPKSIREAYSKPDAWNNRFTFLHGVYPREKTNPRRRDYANMPWASCYVALEDRALVDEGGFTSMPYIVGRYRQTPKLGRPRGPGITSLPDIKMINEVAKILIKAAHKAIEPPILAHEDAEMAVFSQIPGAWNPGMLAADGRALAQPMAFGKVEFGDEWLERLLKKLDGPFLSDLFAFLEEQPEMTAYQAQQIVQTQGRLLAPVANGQLSDYVRPLFARELDIASYFGWLPPMPPEVQQSRGAYKLIYEAPLARALRAEEASGYLQLDRWATDHFTATQDRRRLDWLNDDKAVPALASIWGAPADWINDPDTVAQIRDSQAQQAQTEQATQAAPGTAAIMKAAAVAQGVGRAPKS